jgi:peptidyl-prolyl cis-trans isomerase D
MAIIGKIREKSGLLVIIIGLALLAFILGDYQKGTNGSDDFIGSGTVYGEKIDEKKFQEDINKFQISDSREFQQQQREYTQKDQDASVDKAWNYRVETTILEKEYEALGLDVSQTEFDAYIYGTNGFTLMPDIEKGFVDSITGKFSAKLLQKTIEKLQNSDKPEEQKSWAESREYYISKRKQEKYFSILNQGVYVTKLEAEQEYQAQNEVKSISYVVRRYSEIADDKIKISPTALKAYYEEHKSEKKYENRNSSREVKYFDVLMKPTKKDSIDFDKSLKDISKAFASAANDSLFVSGFQGQKFFSTNRQATFRPEGDPKAKPGMTFPLALDTVFKTASIGQIVGPYSDNGNVRIAKIKDFNTKICKVRHILIKAPKGDVKKIATAQAKADSIVKLLTKDNFGEYVTKFSEDEGSVSKGGVYEDFMDGEMVPEFSKFSTNEPIGKIGTVKTDFGIHIIEVMDRKEVKYPILAFVEKTLVASSETSQQIEDQVYDLLVKLDAKVSKVSDIKKKVELFDTIVSKAKYFARSLTIIENKPSLQGFQTSFAEDKILKLAFDDESAVGTMCSSPIKDKDRYIIAMLSVIHTKGIPAFEEVEKQMEAELIKEEKAKRFTVQMMKKSLDDCAKSGKTQVMKADVNFANAQITGSGVEPEIIGSIFSGMKKGEKSIPLKGDAGVYVVIVDKITKAPATKNYTKEKESLLASLKGNVSGATRSALMTKADVVDNRRFQKAGIRQ